MITIRPVPRALVPVDRAAAARISAPNYDEFQGDREVWEVIREQPESILRVTMPHCAVDSPDAFLKEGGAEALGLADELMRDLEASKSTHVLENLMWIYELADLHRLGVRQIGLGAMASIAEIRTDATPSGTIIRNEGIREEKAHGRADLIRATRSFIGTVNNTVEDPTGRIEAALVAAADSRECDLACMGDGDVEHKIWLLTEIDAQAEFVKLFAEEPSAYVADGNHRSAAAAMLGEGEFLSVFFPAATMGLAPYNRIVKSDIESREALEGALAESFEIERVVAEEGYQPTEVHDIGVYFDGEWLRLRPKDGAYDPANAVEAIDADLVQRKIFDAILGIGDARDKRLTFVGGNRDAAYIKSRVDSGEHQLAVTLAPVTMQQFIEVCRQNRIMPPKSTWFQPKIRSGLVIALLG